MFSLSSRPKHPSNSGSAIAVGAESTGVMGAQRPEQEKDEQFRSAFQMARFMRTVTTLGHSAPDRQSSRHDKLLYQHWPRDAFRAR